MFSKKTVVLGLIVIFAAGLVALAQIVKPQGGRVTDPGDIVCSRDVDIEFLNNALVIYCPEEKGPRKMSFTVLPNNVPSPDTLMLFINPYVMTSRQTAVLPEMSEYQEFWHQRILIRYDSSKKITGIGYTRVFK